MDESLAGKAIAGILSEKNESVKQGWNFKYCQDSWDEWRKHEQELSGEFFWKA